VGGVRAEAPDTLGSATSVFVMQKHLRRFLCGSAYRTARGARENRLLLFALVLVLVLGCGAKRRSAPPEAGPSDLAAEAAKLTPFLPAHVGRFSSAAPASTNFRAVEPRVEAERKYKSGDGRTLSVLLISGDLRPELLALASDEEHAFGSDTPTYWHTTSIRGWRTRIAEERPAPRKSESYVQVGPNHVVIVSVFPAATKGESASLAALLDLEALAKTGGVPGPPRASSR
jgi:hypothetical protein